ncbi:MAG: HNH endonuclease [Nanoarchaeota archaeon]|nr:HNH endonuclease [Nanoarchaeota archaeon]
MLKGSKMSEEHKQKIRIAMTGKKRPPFSKEWRDNLSKARKGKKFSEIHKRRISASQKGDKGNNWQGGKTENRKKLSFNWVKYPKHPESNNSGFVRRYRYVMEQHIGRYLNPGEVVHHINEDPTDDRLENLMLFPNQGSHASFHAKFRNQNNK